MAADTTIACTQFPASWASEIMRAHHRVNPSAFFADSETMCETSLNAISYVA